MYLVNLKTLLVTAMRGVFDDQYPQPDFRVVNIGIEYPVERQNYPAIWVDYDDTAPLRQAGVGHYEQAHFDTGTALHTRFRFEGTAIFTIATLSSLERDRLFDEMIRVLAFGKEDGATAQFRGLLEDNEFIAANAKFDEIGVGGNAAAPGTPWGTDEVIYERTVSLDLIGEFVADPVTGSLLPLSGFIIDATMDITIDPLVDQGAPYDQPVASVATGLPPEDGKGTWI